MAIYRTKEYNYKALGDGVYGVKSGKPEFENKPIRESISVFVAPRLKGPISNGNCGDNTDNKVSLGMQDTASYLPDKLGVGCGLEVEYTGPIGNQKMIIKMIDCNPSQSCPQILLNGEGEDEDDEDTYLPKRCKLNFIGDCIDIVDDPLNQITNIIFTCAGGTQPSQDIAVKASPTDSVPAWLFNKKIRVQSPITMTLNNVGGDEFIRLGLDTGALPFADEKVAAANGCTPGFLEDVMDTGDGLAGNVVGCKYVISLDETSARWKKPIAGKWVKNNYDITQPKFVNSLTLVTPPTGWENVSNNNAAMFTANDNAINITKAGRYLLFIKGNVEINDSIAALRIGLTSNNGAVDGGIDQKFGAGDTGRSFVGVGNAYSLYDGAAIRGFGQMSFGYLNQGDLVRMYARISTYVDDVIDVSTQGVVRIVGNDGTTATPGLGAQNNGLAFGVIYLGDSNGNLF